MHVIILLLHRYMYLRTHICAHKPMCAYELAYTYSIVIRSYLLLHDRFLVLMA